MPLTRRSANAVFNPAMIALGLILSFSPYTLSWLTAWYWTLIFPGAVITIIFIFRFITTLLSDRDYKKITSPENIITSWEITGEQWRALSIAEFNKTLKSRIVTFIILSAVFVPIAVAGFLSKDPFERYLGLIIGIAPVLVLWAALLKQRAPRLRESRVIISKTGAALNGHPTSWESKNTAFHHLSLEKKIPACMEISFTYPMGGFKVYRDDVKIPVPEGKEDAALEALSKLRNLYSGASYDKKSMSPLR